MHYVMPLIWFGVQFFVPASHVGSVPLQVLSFKQVLVSLPFSTYPSSHEKWHNSPGLATPSLLNWQEIIPFTGAKILGHMAIRKTANAAPQYHTFRLTFQ